MASENHEKLISTTSKYLRPPVLYFKYTQQAELQNSNIMVAFKGNLGNDLEVQQGNPLNYGPELRDPTGISNLFHHHEDRDKIIHMIQIGSQYPISST